MQTKLVEIRDNATCIIAMAIQPGTNAPEGDRERWMWQRCGYGSTYGMQLTYVLLIPIDPDVMESGRGPFYDTSRWTNRTMRAAHRWLERHFDTTDDGAVLDVRVILGERAEPVASDQSR